MLKKRIIPCLDIKDGRTVKGVNFVGLRDAGDPVELARIYSEVGADELVFLDITATNEKRKTLVELVKQVARQVAIPFTVGGGVGSVEDAYHLLQSGADKVAINSAAVKRPELIKELADKFGNQCVVLAVDAKLIGDTWKVFLNGGRVETEKELFSWVKQAEQLGAGEILFTSMDHDGTKAGFAIDALKKMNDMLSIPIIASGGAGNIDHFIEVFQKTDVSAALAASIFHFKEVDIPTLKKELENQTIEIRL
jgi:imidazole glycerol-phosphate synthase subunit HisF